MEILISLLYHPIILLFTILSFTMIIYVLIPPSFPLPCEIDANVLTLVFCKEHLRRMTDSLCLGCQHHNLSFFKIQIFALSWPFLCFA